MLKVGVVGLGGISVAHLNGWENIDGAEVVAVCDIRAEKLAEHPGKRCYQSFDEMLEKEKLDIVDVCVPTYLHIEFSLKALNKGIHVVCEKPISLHAEDVAKVYDAAQKNGVKFMVAQVVRFMLPYDYLKEVFSSSKYGKLLSGTMSRIGPYPKWSYNNWMLDESLSGLVPYDVHIHDLDYLVYAFGKPCGVSAKRAKSTGGVDYLNATYDYGDFFINVEGSWYDAPFPFSYSFKFQFENAVLAHSSDGKFIIYEKDGTVLDLTPGAVNDNGDIGLPASNAYEDELRYFFTCVKEGRPADKIKPEELTAVLETVQLVR